MSDESNRLEERERLRRELRSAFNKINNLVIESNDPKKIKNKKNVNKSTL